MTRIAMLLLALSCAAGCGGAAVPSPGAPGGKGAGLAAKDTPDDVNIALARQKGLKQAFQWSPWSKETFERARREGKYILLHGAAVWCHWCHVMEETTYLDPEVGRILNERFVTIRVDVDSRPDIEERYGAWGWPATILFKPDATEIGKFRGYLPPEELRQILRDIEKQALDGDDEYAIREPGAQSARVDELRWVALRVARDMDWYYDPEEGGWGMRQKAPLGANAEFETRRARRGDSAAKKRALFSLHKHAEIIDPVWGGIYQYSTGSTWKEPHFEKLMTYQAENLAAFAAGYAISRDPKVLSHAEAIVRYVNRFLSRKDGGFYVSQDADVGTHDKRQRFVDGNVYYARDEKGRLALGTPWVDDHVYGYENGIIMSALVSLHEASGKRAHLARAERAAAVMLKSHVEPTGAVRHDADAETTVRYLADVAGVGRALAQLAEATGDDRYRDAATRIAGFLTSSLLDEPTGAFWANTVDPDAAGVFARRRRPFSHNVLAARFLAALADATDDESYRERARRTLAAIATPAALDSQGRMVGPYLLALDEAGSYPW